MIASLLLTLAPSPPPAPDTETVRYDDASLELEGELLDHRFIDLGVSGPTFLCIALRLEDNTRELRFHELGQRALDTTPTHTIPVLEDVLAYGFADVRSEPGRELFFLTRSSVWSYSLTRSGYRDNVRRLVQEQLLYDVPDNRALAFWAYVIPDEGGDRLLLPTRQSFGIWGPRDPGGDPPPGTAGEYRRENLFVSSAIPASAPDSPGSGRGRPGDRSMTVDAAGEVRIETIGGDGVFLGDDGHSSTLLRDDKSFAAPALIDLDGEGGLDLVLRHESALHVHRSRGGELTVRPTAVEEFPDYLTGEEQDLYLQLIDLDADGDRDLLARIEEEVDGFENAQIRLLVLLNDGRRLLPPKPDQVLRFEAAMVRTEIVDVDGEGNPDLVVRKFELPSMLETVTGLEFSLTTLVFFATGEKGRPFERKPGLKQTQVFDENTVADAVKNRRLKLDCDGDDLPDLVEVDLHGRIAIRRLRHESGFFSGDSWELEENPWKRFETRGSLLEIEVIDANGDGLADIVSPGDRSLTLFLSSRVR